MTERLRLDFCEVNIFDNYMIVVMDTAINLTLDSNAILVSVAGTYFKNKPFVYITHRINSYSVDPAIYKETSKIKNLMGFCVVSENWYKKVSRHLRRAGAVASCADGFGAIAPVVAGGLDELYGCTDDFLAAEQKAEDDADAV